MMAVDDECDSKDSFKYERRRGVEETRQELKLLLIEIELINRRGLLG